MLKRLFGFNKESTKEIRKNEKKDQLSKNPVNYTKKIQQLKFEIKKYLNTIHPSFLFVPGFLEALIELLEARYSDGKYSIQLSKQHHEMFFDFYNSEFNIFIKALERKGIAPKGMEREFINMFFEELNKNNLERNLSFYGDFIKEEKSKKEILTTYIQLNNMNERLIYDTGSLKFLSIYLYQKEIFSHELDLYDLIQKLEYYEEMYKFK